MSIVGIHHVQLAMPAGRERDAVAFYSGILGIPQVAKPGSLEKRGGCWFENDAVRVHLGVELDFRPARKAHPALLVDDLPVVRRRLEGAGVEAVQDEALPGYERFYVDDPFGNRLELLTES
jgi:catechol 2,3-dioxygenase-like lactoylglutathione lyase family enzyme